eukprot:620347_1
MFLMRNGSSLGDFTAPPLNVHTLYAAVLKVAQNDEEDDPMQLMQDLDVVGLGQLTKDQETLKEEQIQHSKKRYESRNGDYSALNDIHPTEEQMNNNDEDDEKYTIHSHPISTNQTNDIYPLIMKREARTDADDKLHIAPELSADLHNICAGVESLECKIESKMGNINRNHCKACFACMLQRWNMLCNDEQMSPIRTQNGPIIAKYKCPKELWKSAANSLLKRLSNGGTNHGMKHGCFLLFL